ncbi:MAG: acyl-CoA dehydrogenase family er 9, partial [Solirubrobacteraceae bacterium]|nr:acyl-CoA dehydrogenase family er 9 [Solirubrobacteraceae bacterium]
MSDATTTTAVTSFSKALMLGEIHEDMVFPYPIPSGEEADRVRGLVQAFRSYAAEHIDSHRIDEEGWIPDEVFTDLGELGLMGLYVPEEYGGQGLSQTGYARVFEGIGQADGSLTVALGVHQSIGMKGIVLYGSDEQKQRFLPELASGRKLAGFALTEPNAGSDAYHVESRAVQQPDGSWVLNGEKRFIGNGGRGSVFVAFARAEVNGKDSHIALILEKGMKGFEAGDRYATMGLRGNDLRPLYFNDVRVPPENVLGEPGEGFKIAMQILNNGRLSLGTGSVGLAKRLIDLSIDHVKQREQFGQPLA